MAETKLNNAEKAKTKAEIAFLYFRKNTQEQIAEKLTTLDRTFTQQMVSYYLRQLQKEWLKDSQLDFNKAKARELAKIDALEREYMEGWLRSRGTVKKKHSEQSTVNKTEVEQTASIHEAELVGDPRFLQGLERCIELRSKILGFFAPVKFQSDTKITVETIDWNKLPPEACEAIIRGEDPAKFLAFQMN